MSKAKAARRVSVRLAVFILPLAALLSLPVVLAVAAGEAMPVSAVVAFQQANPPLIYEPADNAPIFAYKQESANMHHAPLLVVGSSRMLQFRHHFFREPRMFYNASGQGWGLREVETLVGSLTYTPAVLIIGLDQVWFNADFVDWEAPHTLDISPTGWLARLTPTGRRVIDNLLRGEMTLDDALARREPVRGGGALGLNAIMYGRGYRLDGSHQEGDLLVNPALGELARSHDLERAPEGWRQFVMGDALNSEMLARVRTLITAAQADGMTVVLVFPPFMPSIAAIMRTSGDHTYLAQASAAVSALADETDAIFFDFTDPTLIGGRDEELYDGWHSTELLSLKMTAAMADTRPDVFAPYVSAEQLARVIASASSPLEVFPSAG